MLNSLILIIQYPLTCGDTDGAADSSQEPRTTNIIIYQVQLDSDGLDGGEGGGGGGACVALGAGALTDLQVVTQRCVDIIIVECTVTHSFTQTQPVR